MPIFAPAERPDQRWARVLEGGAERVFAAVELPLLKGMVSLLGVKEIGIGSGKGQGGRDVRDYVYALP